MHKRFLLLSGVH